MAKLRTTTVTGKVSATVAASAATDYIRLQEFAASLSGRAPLHHQHVVADLTDFAVGVAAQLPNDLVDTPTLDWSAPSGVMVGQVRLKPTGALRFDGEGVLVDLGTAHTQAAAGDHTHSQLHNPVTLGSSITIDLTLAGQQLAGEVRLAALGGLRADNSGVSADFGTGHNQVARGDHTHANDHSPVTVSDSLSIDLMIGSNQELSGVVRLDPAPSSNRGKLGVGSAGLYVGLGTTADSAAAGNHGHAVVTALAPGFMSSQDKIKLDGIVTDPNAKKTSLRVTLEADGLALPSGVAEYVVMPYSGTVTGWDIETPRSGVGVVVNVLKSSFVGFPPGLANSVAGTQKPTLVSPARLNRNLNLSDWAAGGYFDAEDVFAFYVEPGATAKRVSVQLRITKA